MKELLKEFIEWAQENSQDAWWIYENTDEAIKKFMQHKKKVADKTK